MGYYTRFKFKTYLTEEQENKLDKISYDCYGYSIDNDCKWGSFVNDMIEFSKLYPDQIFIIDGSGEDPSDTWTEAFKNGKHIIKYVTLPSFTEEELNEL